MLASCNGYVFPSEIQAAVAATEHLMTAITDCETVKDDGVATHVRVDCAEFCRLALSHRRLDRCNRARPGVRSLVDRDTGERFTISAGELLLGPAVDDVR